MTTLDVLVTSRARRRLVLALWGERTSGSASSLASRIGVSFAAAFRELRKLARERLVTSHRVDGVEEYSANWDHPNAAALASLAAPPMRVPKARTDGEIRGRLGWLGAPLGVDTDVTDAPLVETVALGARLARRDPSVARAMPVLLHARRREILDHADEVIATASRVGAAHALGFLCAVAAELGGDQELATFASRLRDHRVRNQDFFETASHARETPNPLANRWGLRMNMSADDFASLFRRFEAHER